MNHPDVDHTSNYGRQVVRRGVAMNKGFTVRAGGYGLYLRPRVGLCPGMQANSGAVGAAVSERDGQHLGNAVARPTDLCRGTVRRLPGHGIGRSWVHFRGTGLTAQVYPDAEVVGR